MNNFEFKSNQPSPEIMIEDCDISLRALNYLQVAGFNKLSELVNYTEEELKEKMPLANSKTLKEIQEILAEHNLEFKTSK